MLVCLNSNDPFLEDKVIWVAQLSNGLSVYQDDDRPKIKERSAWIRLAKYLEEEDVSIDRVFFRFRSHVISLPRSESGHYFAKSAGAWLGRESKEAYVYGYVRQDKLILKKYACPELVVIEVSEKPLYLAKAPFFIPLKRDEKKEILL